MNIIDVIVILLITMFGVIGMKKGFIKTLVSFVGIVLVFILSYLLKGFIAEWLSLNLPFFNFTGAFKGATILNVIIYQLIAFFVVFAILMTIYSIAIKVSGLIEKILKFTIILSIPTKIGGLIVGILEGIIVSLILIVFLSLPVLNFGLVRDSVIRKYLYNISPIVGNITSNTNNAIDEIMELKNNFDKNENKEEFNIECFEALLKHHVIGTSYSEKLVYSEKLKIDKNKAIAIINKYK